MQAQKNCRWNVSGGSVFFNQGKELLHSLLGEARTFGGTLAGLELGIAFADHIQRTTALHHLAIGVAAFGGIERGKNFHSEWW
jgi:hypothetical protein